MSKLPVARKHFLLIVSMLSLSACTREEPQLFVSIADARVSKAQFIDTGEAGDSVGDILVFDQPLLDPQQQQIGSNSGTCIRTRTGHSFQCQWTLTLEDGSIQVAGREFDQGESEISIVGGTGRFAGITGDLVSVNNGDGTFRQTLRYWLR